MNPVACIVLAAGNSTRFGRDKRQIKNNEGRTLLDMTLSSIPAIFQQQILVLHSGDETLGSVYAKHWQVVYAKFAAQGMGASIAAAITHVADCSGVLVVLADMPLVMHETYVMLANAVRPDRIVTPYFSGQRGNPVMIGRDFFASLAELTGDSGARQLMQQHPECVERLEVHDPGILRDVDTPAALLQVPGFEYTE